MTQRITWEYQTTSTSLTDEHMNIYGARGWELVAAVPRSRGLGTVYDLVWKRQRIQT